jgi:2-polyprenyl-6-hydroxyphenyl methylase/3-demethylubiquinone-9 3-methyltransferase
MEHAAHEAEVAAGRRFEFGKNWQRFLDSLTEERIVAAGNSLLNALRVQDLRGKSFLDIGSGSGLFSLAARRLGATVVSFDYDPDSVACGVYLKQRYFPGDNHWSVSRGSVLDEGFVRGLGSFDIVYSWGVLHHTGDLWTALANVAIPVRPGGHLFIAVYNDEGPASRRWQRLKKTYNETSKPVRGLLLSVSFAQLYWRRMLKDLLLLRPGHTFRTHRSGRGMSLWHDLVDWVGGYPFEVAKPEEIFNFYRERGFYLENLTTCNNLGCNEFVFRRPL